MSRSKKYRSSLDKLKGNAFYGLSEAIKLLRETNTVKFDATAEVHMYLNIDPKKSEQALRGTIALPHGSGKKLRIQHIEGKIKR